MAVNCEDLDLEMKMKGSLRKGNILIQIDGRLRIDPQRTIHLGLEIRSEGIPQVQ